MQPGFESKSLDSFLCALHCPVTDSEGARAVSAWHLASICATVAGDALFSPEEFLELTLLPSLPRLQVPSNHFWAPLVLQHPPTYLIWWNSALYCVSGPFWWVKQPQQVQAHRAKFRQTRSGGARNQIEGHMTAETPSSAPWWLFSMLPSCRTSLLWSSSSGNRNTLSLLLSLSSER